MTLIFNDRFDAVIRRINHSSSASTPSKRQAEKQPEDFSKTLAEIEKGRGKNNESGSLGASDKVGQAQEPVLSNIGEPQKHISRARLSRDLGAAQQPNSSTKTVKNTDLTGVKSPNPDVKTPAPPPPVLLPGNSVPETPIIASARRVYKTPQPELPKLGSRPYSEGDIKTLISSAGKLNGVDPLLGLAVARAESSFKPDAVSKDGHYSKGLFQLLDSTARDMLTLTGVDEEKYDPFDPSMNSLLGTRYLRRLHDIFSERTDLGKNLRTVPASSADNLEKLAVAAFNAGEGNVATAQARAEKAGKDPADFFAVEPHLPASTRQYVTRVQDLKAILNAEFTPEEEV